MRELLSRLREEPEAEQFAAPLLELFPSRSDPYYQQFVKEPMDLRTVGERLERGEFKGEPRAFRRVLRLVFTNCLSTTPHGDDANKTAYKMLAKLEEWWDEAFGCDEEEAASASVVPTAHATAEQRQLLRRVARHGGRGLLPWVSFLEYHASEPLTQFVVHKGDRRRLRGDLRNLLPGPNDGRPPKRQRTEPPAPAPGNGNGGGEGGVGGAAPAPAPAPAPAAAKAAVPAAATEPIQIVASAKLARYTTPTPGDGRQWRGPNRLTMVARPQPVPQPQQHLKPAGLPGMLDVSAAILHGGTGAEAIQSGNGRERALLRPGEDDDIGAL